MTFHASRSCTERKYYYYCTALLFLQLLFSFANQYSRTTAWPLVQSPHIKPQRERERFATQQANSGLVSTASTGGLQVERKATDWWRQRTRPDTRVWLFSCVNLMSSVRTVFSGTRKPISVVPKPHRPFSKTFFFLVLSLSAMLTGSGYQKLAAPRWCGAFGSGRPSGPHSHRHKALFREMLLLLCYPRPKTSPLTRDEDRSTGGVFFLQRSPGKMLFGMRGKIKGWFCWNVVGW